MAVEPQVFICYGKPDKAVAHQLAAEFWRNRIECYNYMSKPVEDRIGSEEVDHRAYIYTAQLFIAIISDESIPRFLVTEELAIAHQIATALNNRLYRVYISLLDRKADIRFPKPDVLVHWHPDSAVSIAAELLQRMGPEFLERNHKAWEINKNLYAGQWKELDELYSHGQSA